MISYALAKPNTAYDTVLYRPPERKARVTPVSESAGDRMGYKSRTEKVVQ